MSRPIVLVIVADLWWGLSAIYWSELGSVDPVDQLGWRVVLGLATMAIVFASRRTWPFRGLTALHVRYGVGAAFVVFANWSVFLWAVANDQAVEASLGYFLMPLISVALAIVVLNERPSRLQVVALALAAIGMTWMLALQGTVPWVALVLGFSFAAYGLIRKRGPWPAVEGQAFEMALVAPVGAVLLLTRLGGGEAIAGDASSTTWLLLSISGLITVVPLILFANAARKAPLIVVGLLQYLVPVTQFVVGWRVLDESVSAGRFAGFGFIWAALALVVVDQLRSQGPVDRLAPGLDERRIRA